MKTPRGSEVLRNNFQMRVAHYKWLALWWAGTWLLVFMLGGIAFSTPHVGALIKGGISSFEKLDGTIDIGSTEIEDGSKSPMKAITWAWIGSGIAGFFLGGGVVIFWNNQIQKQESKLVERKYIRGTKRDHYEEVQRLIEQRGEVSTITLGSVRIPKRIEEFSMLITGSPGTGKTVLLMEILDEFEKRGDNGLIYDRTGDFIKRFYREERGDVILNPFDIRGRGWNFLVEGNIESISHSLVPDREGKDEFWRNAARQIFEGLAKKCKSNQEMAFAIACLTVQNLLKLLKGDIAQRLLAEPILAANALATASSYLGCFRMLPDKEDLFSVNDWARTRQTPEGKSGAWVFLSCPQVHQEQLKPILSLWFDIAAKGILSREQDEEGSNTVLFIDELASLNALPAVPIVQSEGRKFRGSTVIAFQNFPQIENIYGKETARSIAATGRTKAFLAVEEADTADWCSRTIGDVEEEELRETLSMGPSASRDGVSLARQRTTRRAVMASEILNLPDLTAFLKLPGDYPVCKIRLRPKDRPIIAESFVPSVWDVEGYSVVNLEELNLLEQSEEEEKGLPSGGSSEGQSNERNKNKNADRSDKKGKSKGVEDMLGGGRNAVDR
jgi:type IV conjugative transfer system coupling protein TraD